MLYGMCLVVCFVVFACVPICVLFLMYRVMCVWYALYVFVFVRVVVKCVCVLFATSCVMLFGLRFVCGLVVVCLAVCVLCS